MAPGMSERARDWWIRGYLIFAAVQGFGIGLTGLLVPSEMQIPLRLSPLNARFVAALYLGGAIGVLLIAFKSRRTDARLFVIGFGVATGLISNSWGLGIYDRLDSTDMFDATVISGEVGVHKPQPEIYLLACERLGIEPAAAVFVDDLRENCAGAEEVGMTAILHRGSAQTIARLEELLGVALAAAC